jgi:DNA-binding PadR family transcriptional regulator
MLGLLTEGPPYGLRLREEFEDRTGEVWPLSVGQVHTTLQRRERDGLAGSDRSAAPSAGLTRGRRRVPDA